jgi:hypothetical protein
MVTSANMETTKTWRFPTQSHTKINVGLHVKCRVFVQFSKTEICQQILVKFSIMKIPSVVLKFRHIDGQTW